MNIYYQRQLKCSECGKIVGEVDEGTALVRPLCSKCYKKEKQTGRRGVQNILVPIDDTKKSYTAIDAAIYFAKHFGSKVFLLHVVPAINVGSSTVRSKLKKEVREEANETIKKAKGYCEKKGLTTKHKIVVGEAADSILDVAKSQKFDLVIMGSSGRGAAEELFMGSVSNYVFHESEVPVLMVKSTSRKFSKK